MLAPQVTATKRLALPLCVARRTALMPATPMAPDGSMTLRVSWKTS